MKQYITMQGNLNVITPIHAQFAGLFCFKFIRLLTSTKDMMFQIQAFKLGTAPLWGNRLQHPH